MENRSYAAEVRAPYIARLNDSTIFTDTAAPAWRADYFPIISDGAAFIGQTAEIVVFNSVLSAGNRTLVYDYLADKYAL